MSQSRINRILMGLVVTVSIIWLVIPFSMAILWSSGRSIRTMDRRHLAAARHVVSSLGGHVAEFLAQVGADHVLHPCSIDGDCGLSSRASHLLCAWSDPNFPGAR